MAAVVLTSEFYDDEGLAWAIYVYDKSASGIYTTTFRTAKGSILVTDEGDDNDPFKRIITKKLSFTMLMNTAEYTGGQRTAILDVYNGITTSPEGRYYVLLVQGSTRKFVGKILADVGDLTLNYHRDVTINATDGLIQLKDIDYRPVDYDDRTPESLIPIDSFVEHFTEILKRNDVVDFFYNDALFAPTTVPMFTTSSFWTNPLPTALGHTGDMMKCVAKKNTYFDQEKDKAYRVYDKCFDILTDLLTGFNMRMYYSDGCYHIEQMGYQDNLTLVRYAYDYTGTATTSPGNKVTHDITDNDDIYVLADPSLKHIPPLKAVILKQNKKYDNIFNGIDAFLHLTDPDNPGPHNMGYVIAAGNELVFDLRFLNELGLPILDPGYIQFEMSIKIGDYYLINNPVQDNILKETATQGVYDWKEFQWTLTPSTFKILRNNNGFVQLYFYSYPNTIVLGLSDEIPEDGDFIFELVSIKYLDLSFVEMPTNTARIPKWTIRKDSRIYIVTNGDKGLTEVPDNTIIYELGDVKNSIVYEAKMSYFDADTVAVFNSLWFKIASGASFIYSPSVVANLWADADMGVSLPIQELAIKQMLGMRRKPNRVVRLSMLRKDGLVCHMDDRYAIGSNLYIPLRMVHNVDRAEYQVSLWSVLKDFSGVNIIRYSDDEPQPTLYSVDLATNKPLTSSIRGYWKWTGVTDPYVTLDEALGFYITSTTTPEEIEEYFDVYKTNIRMEYVDYTTLTFPLTAGDLLLTQYTVEPDNDKFHFALCENETVIIKYLKV